PPRAPGPPPPATPDTLVGMNEPRSDAGSPPPTPPPGRYDAERPLGSTLMGKSLAVFLGVLVLALVVAAAFAVYRITSTPSITGEQIGVDVIDDERTDIVIDVTRDEPETAVYCIVRGLTPARASSAVARCTSRRPSSPRCASRRPSPPPSAPISPMSTAAARTSPTTCADDRPRVTHALPAR